MSQIYKSASSAPGVTYSVEGTAPIEVNGVSGVPASGNVVLSAALATTTTVGVASFNSADFTVSGSGEVSSIGGGGGISSINIQTFTTSGTYSPTSGMVYSIIEIVAGGAAGGGATSTSVGQSSTAAGGGAGEIARGVFSAATIGASQTVTIGAGGTANSGATGGNGGNTSVGTLISANGGIGGVTLAATNFGSEEGGLGGTGGTGGSFRSPGQNGSYAFTNPGSVLGWSGSGGSSPYGAGGEGIMINNVTFSAVSIPGNNALGYGSGGSGGLNGPSNSAVSGGAGTAGYVLITEYIG